jgi:hypothetical protein
MIGDLLNTNKRREVKTRADQVMFMGKKYRQDKRTGYYVCTTGKKRQRLHVAIWEHEHGIEVPPGCVIHHLDWDKTHNEISNLICVTVEEHETIHNRIGGEAGRAWGYELVKTRRG